MQGGFGGDAGIPRGDVALGRRRRERLGHARSRWTRTSSGRPRRAPAWSAASSCASSENRRQFRNVEVWPEQSNGPGRGRAVPLRLGRAAAHLAARQQHASTSAASTCTAPTNGGQSWEVISPDLTLNDRTQHGQLRRPHARQHRRRVRRRRLRHRRVAAGEGPHLGRHQRRPGAGHARRRQDLDERHEEPARPAAVGVGAQHRAVALRRRHRVPHRRLPPGEQPRPVRLQDDRLRQDLDARSSTASPRACSATPR